MVDCPICGKTNDRGNRFCSGCGEKLPGTGIQCPMCGATNPAGSVVCRDCQARLVPMAPPADAGTDQEWGEAADRAYPYAPLSGDGGEGGAEGPDGVESVGSAADDWLDDLRASADEAVRPGHGERSEALDSGRIEDDFEPLEPDGLLRSRWEGEPGTRRRKVYTVTDKGYRQLEAEMEQWRTFHQGMRLLLGMENAPA
jgi:PadR family transcriptional regulator PadR